MRSEAELKQLLGELADEGGELEASRETVVALVRRRRRVRGGAVGLAVVCLAAGGALTVRAGGASGPVADGSVAAAAGPSGPACVSESPSAGPSGFALLGDLRSCQYLGLTLEAARAQAAREGRDLVVGSEDGTYHGITFEFRTSRVVVDVVHGRVTSALIG
ncbi:hypothetical protein GCM10009665_69910 [Kitasatospora nipponensis]|uniref:Peptidase inhibitor I78 family protein n=1 Tax=Kitasatospora nipponensis TaxID=258049 RepID=A0ABP4HP35_9ACTN